MLRPATLACVGRFSEGGYLAAQTEKARHKATWRASGAAQDKKRTTARVTGAVARHSNVCQMARRMAFHSSSFDQNALPWRLMSFFAMHSVPNPYYHLERFAWWLRKQPDWLAVLV